MNEPKLIVKPGAIRLWEREVELETKAVALAQYRLDFAKKYLAQLKGQLPEVIE